MSTARKNMTREKSHSDPQRSVLDRDRSLDDSASAAELAGRALEHARAEKDAAVCAGTHYNHVSIYG